MILRAYEFQGKDIKIFAEEYHTRITVLLRKENRVFVPMSTFANFRKDALWSVKFVPSGVSSTLMSNSIQYINSHPKIFDSILFPKQFYNHRNLPSVQNGNFH